MSISTNKKYHHMHKAKSALKMLASFSESCNTPIELAELCNSILEAVYRGADKKNTQELKSIYALSLLDDTLSKREVKVKYSIKPTLSKSEQEKIILRLYNKQEDGKRKYSYQQISDILPTKGFKKSKSQVYKIINNSHENKEV
jgi:hypothetical protein